MYDHHRICFVSLFVSDIAFLFSVLCFIISNSYNTCGPNSFLGVYVRLRCLPQTIVNDKKPMLSCGVL